MPSIAVTWIMPLSILTMPENPSAAPLIRICLAGSPVMVSVPLPVSPPST